MKRIKIILILGLLAGGIFGSAYAEEARKSFAEEYKVNKDAMLKVDNRFGSIEIINWDENKVSIQVDVEIEASSQKKADRMLEGVSVSFKATKSLVEAYTELDENGCNNCDIDIAYTIKMPASMSVDLLQKYGDIQVEEINGEAKIGVKYGDLIAQQLNSENNAIYLKYGAASIDLIRGGKLEIAYSEVKIDESNELNLNTSYSELSFEKAFILEIESGYDEYEIETVNGLEIDSEFTEFEIEKIETYLTAELKYGEMEVSHVSSAFEKIYVKTEFADVELGIEAGTSYALEGEAKYGDIEYPGNSKISVEDIGYTGSRVSGIVGDNANSGRKVHIIARHADVEIN